MVDEDPDASLENSGHTRKGDDWDSLGPDEDTEEGTRVDRRTRFWIRVLWCGAALAWIALLVIAVRALTT